MTAPIGGRVGHIQVTEGNYVTNGVTALTSIVSVDPLYVYFDVDERTYLQALAPTRGREGEQAPGSRWRCSPTISSPMPPTAGPARSGFGRWSTTRTGN